MSPGSCLENFQAHPFVECGSHGTCHYFEDKFSFWLVTHSDLDWEPHPFKQVMKGEELSVDRVSRCAVCQLDFNI